MVLGRVLSCKVLAMQDKNLQFGFTAPPGKLGAIEAPMLEEGEFGGSQELIDQQSQ